jgi:hypothetical protein
MKSSLISIFLFLFFVGSKAQTQAFLLKWNQERKYDTVCKFDKNSLSITGKNILQLKDSNCLPVSSHDAAILFFSFSDGTYFLLHSVTILSSITPRYPYFSIPVDSLRPGQYEIYCPHPKDSAYLQWLQYRWNGAPYDSALMAKPLLEIKSDCVLYEGDTFNRYNSSGKKVGRWIVYEIDNRIRKDVPSFYLPFEITFKVEQYYANGHKEGIWKGYYSDGRIGFVCVFKNDILLDGTFYMWDGSIRYAYLSYRNGMYVFRDFTNKRKKFEVSEEELAGWLQL